MVVDEVAVVDDNVVDVSAVNNSNKNKQISCNRYSRPNSYSLASPNAYDTMHV